MVSIILDSKVAWGRRSHQKSWGTGRHIFFLSAIPRCLSLSGQFLCLCVESGGTRPPRRGLPPCFPELIPSSCNIFTGSEQIVTVC